MTRNSRTRKIKLIHRLKQTQKISVKPYRLLRSSVVLKNLNEPLVSLTQTKVDICEDIANVITLPSQINSLFNPLIASVALNTGT